MRFVVLLLGMIAIIITGSVGWFYFENSLAVNVSAFAPDALRPYFEPLTHPSSVANGDVGVFLLFAAALALLGVVLAFARCGWQGALLMIVPLALTAILNPNVLAFTGFQLFVGLFAFFVFRLPLKTDEPKAKPKPKLNAAALEDEWTGRGKAKPNRMLPVDEDEEKEPSAKPKAKTKRNEEE